MQEYRANHRIRAREVFLVAADGKKLGVVGITEAMAAARQAGLDLVEVSSASNPISANSATNWPNGTGRPSGTIWRRR